MEVWSAAMREADKNGEMRIAHTYLSSQQHVPDGSFAAHMGHKSGHDVSLHHL